MKKKKEKVIYIDDGRTVADMSAVSGGTRLSDRSGSRPRVRFKEAWHTYWGAVKLMFVPMLIVICALIIIYMILSFVFLVM